MIDRSSVKNSTLTIQGSGAGAGAGAAFFFGLVAPVRVISAAGKAVRTNRRFIWAGCQIPSDRAALSALARNAGVEPIQGDIEAAAAGRPAKIRDRPAFADLPQLKPASKVLPRRFVESSHAVLHLHHAPGFTVIHPARRDKNMQCRD